MTIRLYLPEEPARQVSPECWTGGTRGPVAATCLSAPSTGLSLSSDGSLVGGGTEGELAHGRREEVANGLTGVC